MPVCGDQHLFDVQAHFTENSAQRDEVCGDDSRPGHVHHKLQDFERKFRGDIPAGSTRKNRRADHQQLSVQGNCQQNSLEKSPKVKSLNPPEKSRPNFRRQWGTALVATVPCLSTAFQPRRRAASCRELQGAADMTLGSVAVETCHCVGYGISAVVLLSLTLLFLGCNVFITIMQNTRRPPRPLETQLI